MYKLSQVGQDTAHLTDEEIKYIETAVVEAVRPTLVARRIVPTRNLPHAGFRTIRGFKATDMADAVIDMDGQNKSLDIVKLSPFDVNVGVIHKEFKLFWRDLISSRGGGIPIDTIHIENAARQIGELEDRLVLSGEATGWRALGIEGLATATGRNTTGGGDWDSGTNALTYIRNAIIELQTDGFLGPYALVLPPTFFGQLDTLIANTGTMLREVAEKMCKFGIFPSGSLYASGGSANSALVLDESGGNFETVIGQNLTPFMQQDEDMNINGKLFEVLTPRILRPEAICEVTSLT